MNTQQLKIRVLGLVLLLSATIGVSLPRILEAAGTFDGAWWIAFSTYGALTTLAFVIGIALRLWVWTSGRVGTDIRGTTAAAVLRRLLYIVFAQRRLLQIRWVGTLHAVMFWSVAALFIIFSLPLFGLTKADLPGLLLSLLYAVVAVGALFLAGRLVFFSRPKRKLSITETLSRTAMPLMIATAAISYFFTAGSMGALFFHYACVMTILALIPYSRLLHIITVPLWTLVRPDGRFSPSLPFDLSRQAETEIAKADLPLGPRRREEFPAQTLLAFDACTRCGRCEDVCPANGTGDVFSPARIMRQLQAANAPSAAPLDLLSLANDEQVGLCTTCGRCEIACPVGLEPLSAILELRRRAAFDGVFEPGHESALRLVAAAGCTWDKSKSSALNLQSPVPWPMGSDGIPADLVYWVGCAGRYDPAGQRVATKVAELLNHAGVRWTTAGAEELCTGDAARRMGDEGLFQKLALQNMELLRQASCKKLLVSCAHCFNTFANEYPALGSSFEVVHHSELLLQMLKDGRLRKLSMLPTKVTFHDPCYLGRYNGRFTPARELLDAIEGVERVEMSESCEHSRCCGGGGGRLWRHDEPGARMAARRAKQAADTDAEILVTGCPFCLTMLEDTGSKAGVRTLDISEIVAGAVRS